VLRAGELERLHVGLDRGGVQVALLVGDAQLQVVLCQRGLDAQAGGGEIVGARLGPGLAGLELAPHAAPQVGLPARGQAQRVAVAGAHAAGVGAGALGAGVQADRGEQPGAVGVGQRLGLAVRGLGLADVLVGAVGVGFQAVQHRVAVGRPPRQPAGGRARLGGLPVAGGFLVRVGHRQRGAHVVGPDGAGRKQRGGRQGGQAGTKKHGRQAKAGFGSERDRLHSSRARRTPR